MPHPFLNRLLDIHSPSGHHVGTCWCQRPTRRDSIRRHLGITNLDEDGDVLTGDTEQR